MAQPKNILCNPGLYLENLAKVLGSEVDSIEKKESPNAGGRKREGRTIYASNRGRRRPQQQLGHTAL